ncbi:16S rRNA (adenine(1518)-N(6)/adenine(1519)-N(6))-dimethyltransferase RsmA [Candidatus Endomicrobiellum agilis]|uniref:16S rRNA (adenine(1518)-N(6)/adenine(1519)-N(6))- dimethyltransferase RsmA n=1 Tax=Candidatus Endomicrobiellum agilis TaxID=3238957 RepID=UPI00357B7031|nr:16S rRNA (adenine(1518)-N(6)/adenine(1519)-N(6))-dimethyltransferase RsmA [Endomicrobium sp.]
MRQKYGQNFLIDNNIANNIIKAANLEKHDEVLEIGSGKGVLTKIIQPQVKNLVAIEADEILSQRLNHYFSFHGAKNIKIINMDFLRYDIPNTELKVISNLPYNVGTAIIQKILPLKNWTIAVFMLQKEVTQRLAASPDSKAYGYISIFTSYYADCKILFDVSPRCFNPTPKVISSVMKLINKTQKPPDPIFFDFIKHAFSMRRKTILNCLSSFKDLERNKAARILDNCALDPFLRPDKLSISDFLLLTDEIRKYIICST